MAFNLFTMICICHYVYKNMNRVTTIMRYTSTIYQVYIHWHKTQNPKQKQQVRPNNYVFSSCNVLFCCGLVRVDYTPILLGYFSGIGK